MRNYQPITAGIEENMEKEIDKIWKERLKEMLDGKPRDTTLKLAVLDGFKAGMEEASKIYQELAQKDKGEA